ncbi:hypothetical protein HPB50_016903 [Hyalomma asiaticum]|uniref:Uncharacterized protein n=1 Tax=Hyalomma asiaticum TaxID=266040 RepID=A0ACB7T7X3_HYAAI|nr:hypothetical protein HPB50_016903 [Hyalomma asiaticum]
MRRAFAAIIFATTFSRSLRCRGTPEEQRSHEGRRLEKRERTRPGRRVLAPYGEVTDVNRERWRVSGVSAKGSTTRVLSLKVKAGVTIEDVPHQVRVAGELALVVIPGKGHIRRDCPIPRCQRCRRFGHDETQCVPTYANITGPTTNKNASENFMDEVEAEEAAATAPEKPKKLEPPPTSDMPPLKQRRLDAAAESSHQTSVEEADTRQLEDADHESPKHGEPSSTSVRSEARRHWLSRQAELRSAFGAGTQGIYGVNVAFPAARKRGKT